MGNLFMIQGGTGEVERERENNNTKTWPPRKQQQQPCIGLEFGTSN